MFRILLICLGGFVQGNIKDDVGDIPYENQDRRYLTPVPKASAINMRSDAFFITARDNAVDKDIAGAVRSSTGSDYGDIPYEKAIVKHRDYGDIPYEKDIPKLQDYGNIPYEKAGDTKGSEVDIKGKQKLRKIMEILGGRDVPDLIKTTGAYSVDHRVVQTSQPKALVTKMQSRKEKKEDETARMRAASDTTPTTTDDSGFVEYASPRTIDDSGCDPKYQTCSFCTEKHGYRVYCLNGTTTRAPSELKLLLNILKNLTKDYEDYNSPKILTMESFNRSVFAAYPTGWAECPSTTSTTTTPTPTDPPHPLTGHLIAKCFVCGMFEPGIPVDNTICADSFMTHSYKKHCKFLNREGWYVNGTEGYYMWGQWTGGCAMRFTDISGVYTQRTCRNNRAPAVGSHYISRRMAKLEAALKRDTDGCVSTPEASLVPLSRGISLYSRFTACVCSTDYCNSADREALSAWYTAFAVGVLGIFECVLQRHY